MLDDIEDWVLPELLRERASGPDAERSFLHAQDGSSSYAETFVTARRAAAGLARIGVEAGDHVLIMSPNSAAAVHTWLGANMIGAVDVTINTAYRGASLEHVLDNTAARVICIHESLLGVLAASEAEAGSLETVVVYADGGDGSPWPTFERARAIAFADLESGGSEPPPHSISYRDIASVIYTSGTTGPAKGVMMPHAQTYLLAATTVEGLRLGPADVYHCVHPLYHMAAKFMAVYAMLLARGAVVLDTGFAPSQWLGRMRSSGATVSLLHGPMIEMVDTEPARDDDADNPIERILAVPLPARIGASFERRFGLKAIETWGMTEINAVAWTPYDEPLRTGSCGRVLEDCYELAAVDPETDLRLPPGEVGEFVFRPKIPWTTMQGYLGMPEVTAETWRNLWFHTGDLGRIDPDGYVYFHDRVKERIRRRGENIASYEIEAAALTHPAIRECAAVGVPSGFEDDDDVKLCVVTATAAALDPADVVRHLVDQVPHYMVPRYVERVEALPRTPTNKVQKALLRSIGVNAQTWDRKAAGISVRDVARSGREGADAGDAR